MTKWVWLDNQCVDPLPNHGREGSVKLAVSGRSPEGVGRCLYLRRIDL